MSAQNLAFEETIKAQRIAADPVRSAFVAANAGAGKTRVLTDRVARLLLGGADPAKILCITYTKAAAAEMSHRLFKLLGEWALADEAALTKALMQLEGERFAPRSAEDLARARRLFARALETPGGLKIQTIHSFCESVLKRFPLEAGAPPGFEVVDETASIALANAAIDDATRQGELLPAFERLTARYQPEHLREMLREQILGGHKMQEARAAYGGWRELRDASMAALGWSGESAETIMRGVIASLTLSDMQRAHAALDASGGNPKKLCAAPIGRYFETKVLEEQWSALAALFRKSNGDPRETFGTKKTAEADRWVEGYLLDAQQRFVHAEPQIKIAENAADTEAFLTALEASSSAYERLKALRAGLDYDDLVVYVRRLFATADAAWVRFKLDQGLDHVLLDEAQDTSPAQWRVVEGPLEEFFAGKGARDEARSFFAVGDEKQSIYSFQGADAGLFAEKEQDLGKTIKDVTAFENVRLDLSFRSAAPVLSFVDALFADPEALNGVAASDHPLKHHAKRLGAAGLVELWPRVPKIDPPATKAWDAPVDAPAPSSPPRVLALEIAGRIKAWLDAGELLLSRGRPVRAGDIMILVQSRSALFHEMIRALTERRVPVAGADKLKLLEDAAVEDLLSYARCAVFAADDLSLAETLKSPFFGFSDDDLFALAYGREVSLWRALRERGDERPEWRAAREAIAAARKIALREGAFAFLSHVLEAGAPSGRRRLYARLGEASAEPIAELMRQALDYELANPRSLQGFIVWAERNAGEIKREMEQAGDSVRVMTVHGAKGLEAEIVFLLDAHRNPKLDIGPLLFAPTEKGVVPIVSANKDCDSAPAALARAEARGRAFDEHRRLLYVAATRARDRLYICGIEQGNAKDPQSRPVAERSWHALAENAFARLEGVADGGMTSWGGAILRFASEQTAPADRSDAVEPPPRSAPPLWLEFAAPAERAETRIAPSRLADDEEAKAEPVVYSPLRGANAFLRGRAIHRVLELLPDVPPADRTGAADRLLARVAPDVAESERTTWRDEALAVLTHPTFAPVFAPGSRAEVAIVGKPKRARTGVGGQVDRLAVDGTRVLIVDYKTNRPPPQRIEDVPEAYVAQLAAYRSLLQEIYPDHQIEAALLWTYEARLTPIPAEMLDHAFARLLS